MMRDLALVERPDGPPRRAKVGNRLLALLSPLESMRLLHDLHAVALPAGEVLHEMGEGSAYVYFPADCIVSLLAVTREGESAEVAMVGREGMIGIAAFLGGEITNTRAVVRSAGLAYRLRGAALHAEFRRGGGLQSVLLRYVQTLLMQVAQSVICAQHHTLEQQFCRWLLRSLDRTSGDEVISTQELTAAMLGVRRESVSEMAGPLQKIGVIRCHRGQIAVLDRARLESMACECYAIVRAQTDRLLSPGGA
jgi:CRP-like cAMP-binding protein